MKHTIKRALAYMIDCIICYTIIMLVVQWAILSNVRDLLGITDEWFTKSWNMELYVVTTISIPVWFYFTYFDSIRSKGTFGKRLMKLLVTRPPNGRPGLLLSFQRAILKLLPWEIAHLGVIFPTPLYFEDQPGVRPVILVGLILFVIYFLSIPINRNGQAIYDRWLGTKVTAS